MNASNKNNAEHYSWGLNCDGWHLINTEQLSVIEELVPAGESEKKHFHHRSNQFFYILDGEAFLEMDADHVKMTAGDGYYVESGISHKFINRSQRPVRFLVISSPRSHGDRVNLE
jgi:mannose-6-phosphate isomerase-like protein (cupin superfamily)